MAKALLFDVGDVLMEHNWRLVEVFGQKRGIDFGWRGPFGPESDLVWPRVDAGEITNDDYWDLAAKDMGFDDRIALWRAMATELESDVFAPDSIAFVNEAKAAGILVGVLTNDLVRISSRKWVDAREEFALFDVLVDSTEFGQRKPAPAIYLRAAELLGLAPNEIVFLDDMQYCIDGAHAVDMLGVLVNPIARTLAFNEARRLVGLPIM
jgi:putative hydrolase of the HAD superfamily